MRCIVTANQPHVLSWRSSWTPPLAVRLGVFAAMVLSPACSAPEPPHPGSPATAPATAEAEAATEYAAAADRIHARVTSFRQIEGQLDAGDALSRFTAYFEGRALRYVIERVDEGNGSIVNEYYLENERLFQYHSNARAVSAAGAEATSLQLSFDPAGTLAYAYKTINGTPTDITSDDVLAVRIRFELLKLTATDPRSGGGRR